MIKNLIFDVGNVLFHYRWLEALMDTGMTQEQAAEAGPKIFDETPLWREFDAGNIDLPGIIEGYGELFPEFKDNIAEFITRAERMPIDRPEVWEKMKLLKDKGYRIYLLSNYSDYLFNRHTEGKAFLDYIDGRVVSYEVHVTKPDKEIYEILLSKYDLKPEESLFFDDREENVQTAVSLGISGCVVKSREHINKELESLLY